MRQYEQILSKISPMFYKFISYEFYFKMDNFEFQFEYLRKINLYPVIVAVDIPIKAITYKYITYILRTHDFPLEPYHAIALFESHKKGRYIGSYYIRISIHEIIVNLILNKFIFENEILKLESIKSNYTFKDLFIALVGKDTYDTIRRNIK